jgi:uncharacterized protein
MISVISATEERDDLRAVKEKYRELTDSIRKLGRAATAFSGGVDSSLLAYAAKDALGCVRIYPMVSAAARG